MNNELQLLRICIDKEIICVTRYDSHYSQKKKLAANTMLDNIIKYIQLGGTFDNKIIKQFTCYFTPDNNFITSKEIYNKIINIIHEGIELEPLLLLQLMLHNKNIITIIMDSLHNKLTYKFIISVSPKYMHDYHELIQRLINANYKISFTDSEWEEYIYSDIPLSFIINEYTKTHTLTYSQMLQIINIVDMPLIVSYILSGGIIDTKILENACNSNKILYQTRSDTDLYNKVKFILDNKIEPTQKAFNNIVDSHTKHRTSRACELILLLCDYGYVLTYSDIKYALEINIIIPNIEKYNIVFDSTYLLLCAKKNIPLPYKTNIINYDMNCFACECQRYGSVGKLKQMHAATNIIPDTTCMINACKLKNNMSTLRYLTQIGSKIDITVLKECITTLHNTQLSFIFEQFMLQNNVSPKVDVPTVDVPTVDVPIVVKTVLTLDTTNTERKTDDKIKQYISNIPSTFMCNTNIYNLINDNLKKILKIKNKNINYIDFRRLLLKHNINDDTKQTLMLNEPFLYNGANTVEIVEINEWAYSLLSQ